MKTTFNLVLTMTATYFLALPSTLHAEITTLANEKEIGELQYYESDDSLDEIRQAVLEGEFEIVKKEPTGFHPWWIPIRHEFLIDSTVTCVGEQGNWVDVTFSCDDNIELINVYWDFSGCNVWLDWDGLFMTTPEFDGVDSINYYYPDGMNNDTQRFGFTATGFDSGDYARIAMDLDQSINYGGTPLNTDYNCGQVDFEFSDGTIVSGTYTPIEGDLCAAEFHYEGLH